MTEPATDEPPTVGSLFDQEDYAKVLVYGPQGTGKTTDLAFLAHLGPLVYVNAEAGLKKLPLRKLGVPLTNIRPVKCKTYDELDALYWQLKLNLEDHEEGDPRRITGLALDSYTELTQSLVENAVGERVARATKKGVTEGDLVDEFYTDRDQYGKMTSQMRALTRRFRDLPLHVGISALEKRVVDGDSVQMVPALTPAFTTSLLGYVDVVVYTTVVDVGGRPEYLGVCRPVDKYLSAKDRFGVLPTVLAEPTMDRIIRLIHEDLDLDTDAAQNMYNDRKHAESVEADKRAAAAAAKAAAKADTAA